MAVRHDADPKALMAARAREAIRPRRATGGLTPRIRKAIELMVFGHDDGKVITSGDEAARAVGLKSGRALREAMVKPAVEAFYRQQLVAKRNGLKAIGLGVIHDVMTNEDLRKTPAGNKTRVDAAKVVLVDPVGVQVNTQVNVNGQTVTPGYVIDLRRDERPGIVERHGGGASIMRDAQMIEGEMVTED